MGLRHLKNRGFSLFELMITVLIAAFVLIIGVPSFAQAIAKGRQSAELNALFHGFYLARRESIRRRARVSLCPSTDGVSCAPGPDWSAGWILFENHGNEVPPRRDAEEPLILAHVPGKILSITANRSGFTSRGIRKRATNGTLVVCDPAGRVPPRGLVVSYTGRPRVAERTPDGGPLRCAD
jgi:type IV fimbrial biogenesis protein FimT